MDTRTPPRHNHMLRREYRRGPWLVIGIALIILMIVAALGLHAALRRMPTRPPTHSETSIYGKQPGMYREIQL